MGNKAIIAGIVLIVLLVVGIILNKQIDKTNTSETNTTGTNQNTNTNAQPTSVTVDNSGFNPSSIKVKVGDTVTWLNKTGTTVNVSSDNHPTHVKYPQLNLGNFPNDFAVQLKFDKRGTYTYHNHLNPSQKGTVVVE